MARLNDPPILASESIDALKRRFIRQNREIARVNSNQSQRIRNLETEISRLLAENIALREQAIRATEEAERARSANRFEQDVLALKQRLEAKLHDVSVLVHELGVLPEQARRRSNIRQRRSGLVEKAMTSPDARDWRNRQPIGSILNPEQDGRLPAILEDKYYPRRTLDPSDMQNLVTTVNYDEETTDSPELGPPPVAHFDGSEPITFNTDKSPKREAAGISTTDERGSAIPVTLETRRKRRTSSLLQDMATLQSDSEETRERPERQPDKSKSSTKRKVDASEMEEGKAVPVQDDFVYQRKSAVALPRTKPSRFTKVVRPQQEESSGSAASPQRQLQPTRKALAPKTTNSPTKRKVGALLEKNALPAGGTKSNDKADFVRVTAKNKVQPPLRIDLPVDDNAVAESQAQQPKTPGISLNDVMSPASVATEPSTKAKSATTSEMAVINSLEDVLNGSIGRGSRRARAAVSYAEPNLRDKMRRPDKKLMGAVEGLVKANGSDRDQSREGSEATDAVTMREGVESTQVTSVKDEQPAVKTDDGSWKLLPLTRDIANDKQTREPSSPLGDRETRQLMAKIEARRHKRTHSESEGTSTRIAGSLVTSKSNGADVCQRIEGLSIFDPPSSSPIASPGENTDSARPSARTGRTSLSSAAASRKTNQSAISLTDESTTTTGATKTRRHSLQVQQSQPLPSNSGLARSSSSMSVRNLSTRDQDRDAPSLTAASTKLKRASSAQMLSTSGASRLASTSGATGGSQHTTSTSAGLESGTAMSTRRRSMMV